MKLSKNAIEKNLGPRERRYEVLDDRRPGLALTVYPSGVRTWSVRYYTEGKPWRYVLGKWPTLSIDKARTEATKALSTVAAGTNPQQERIAQRTKAALGLDRAETVAWTWDQYEKKHVDKKLKPSTGREIKRIGKLHILPRIGKLKVADVSPREVKALVTKFAEHAPIGANRVQAILSAYFNWCIDQLIIATNPCAGLKKPNSEKKRGRRRILNERELRWLWKACGIVGFPWGYMLKIGVLTGARRGELAGMTRDELDEPARLWSLPGDRTKNHRPHVIYISNAFQAVLDDVPEHKGDLIFTPNKRPPSGFSKAKKRVDAEMAKLAAAEFEPKPEGWTIHDLRRTCASHMARLPGVNLATVSLCLNHWSEELGGLREIYVQHDQAAATKAAFKAWAAKLTKIVKAKPKRA